MKIEKITSEALQACAKYGLAKEMNGFTIRVMKDERKSAFFAIIKNNLFDMQASFAVRDSVFYPEYQFEKLALMVNEYMENRIKEMGVG